MSETIPSTPPTEPPSSHYRAACEESAATQELRLEKEQREIDVANLHEAQMDLTKWRNRAFEAERAIESAHAACDGPVSRCGTDGARPLAERVSTLRKMLAEAWRDQVEPPDVEDESQEPLPIKGLLIGAFACGLTAGALIVVLILTL